MTDSTEAFRRNRIEELNSAPHDEKSQLEAKHGQVWTTTEATTDFEFLSFLAPYVSVVRSSDNVKGLLEFTHHPRFYFSFTPA